MTNFEKFKWFVNEFADSVDMYPDSFMDGEWNGDTIKSSLESHEDYKENKEDFDNFIKLTEGCGLVDEKGGEGQGEDYFSVYYFPVVDMYIKFDGYYASHYGSEFQEMFEVEPQEKTITVYVKKQKG